MPPFEEGFHNQISKVIVGALQATPMAETSDYIPANGIRFDRAFERLFDSDPRAAELRTKLDRLIEVDVSGGPEYDDALGKWGVARKDVDLLFPKSTEKRRFECLSARSLHR